jgi:hypothetical protein
MRFTKFVLAVGFSLIAVSLVIPAFHSTKFQNTTTGSPQTLQADGTPLPPLPPTHASDVTLLADGTPLPPLPPNAVGSILVADGTPLPPLPPNVNGIALAA